MTDVKIALDPSWVKLNIRNATYWVENGNEFLILRPVGTIPLTLPVSLSWALATCRGSSDFTHVIGWYFRRRCLRDQVGEGSQVLPH
jgi:hypothetical protein